jgi:glutathione synthase
MKIGFVVNGIDRERPRFTTTLLALTAARRGHETWYLGVDDFSNRLDGTVGAHAYPGAELATDSPEAFLEGLQAEGRENVRICVDDLDVLMLRNDPAEDALDRPWAVSSAVLFAQLAVARGTLVLNDPASLADALNKTYFQHFPAAVRPRTVVSRDPDELKEFVQEMGGCAVLKPLQGSGGAGVFFVSDDESPNLNQMIESLSRDGYIVAQEVLPQAEDGDVRMFVMNGEPLTIDGKHAAFGRVNNTADPRSNMKKGGESQPVEVTDAMLGLAEQVRPKLLADGMFLVGIDIAGDKLMEINVFSPGGLMSCEEMYDASFSDAVIDAIEHKVDLRRDYGHRLDNPQLATL